MLKPEDIRVEVKRSFGVPPECQTSETVVAELYLSQLQPLISSWSPPPRQEIEYIKDHCAREIWHRLYGGLDEKIVELARFVFRNAGYHQFDHERFNQLINNLRNTLRYTCPQKNPKQETPAPFSTTAPVKEISRELLMSLPIATTSTSSTGEIPPDVSSTGSTPIDPGQLTTDAPESTPANLEPTKPLSTGSALPATPEKTG